MSKTMNQYFPEARERAVRMVLDNPGQHESRWLAILSIPSKFVTQPPDPGRSGVETVPDSFC